MSLYVYISRRPDPTRGQGPQIAASEWHALADAQADFRPPTKDEIAEAGAGAARANDVVWQRPDGEVAWFSWSEGHVEVPNPDPPIIVRMSQLARELSARVVSETGEIFDATGGHAGFEPWSEYASPPKKPSLWARLFGSRR